jgi:hypothetical protein
VSFVLRIDLGIQSVVAPEWTAPIVSSMPWPDETGDLVTCADCYASLSADDVIYTFGYDWALCIDCAVRRGGLYDASEDRWVRAPYLDDLLERLEAPAH